MLSGGGHDGATGATVIHRFSGVVIASDASSSAHFSMPAATIDRDHAVDLVLPVDEIAGKLQALVTALAVHPDEPGSTR